MQVSKQSRNINVLQVMKNGSNSDNGIFIQWHEAHF